MKRTGVANGAARFCFVLCCYLGLLLLGGSEALMRSASAEFESLTIETKPRTARGGQQDIEAQLARGAAGTAVDDALGSIRSLGESGAAVSKGTPIIPGKQKSSDSGTPGISPGGSVPRGPKPPQGSAPHTPQPPQIQPLQMCQMVLGLIQQLNQQQQQQQGGGQQQQQGGLQQGGQQQLNPQPQNPSTCPAGGCRNRRTGSAGTFLITRKDPIFSRVNRTITSADGSTYNAYDVVDMYFMGELCEGGNCNDDELDLLLEAMLQVEDDAREKDEAYENQQQENSSQQQNQGGAGQQLLNSLPQILGQLLGGGGGGAGGGGGGGGAGGGGGGDRHKPPSNIETPANQPAGPPHNPRELAEAEDPQSAVDSMTPKEAEELADEIDKLTDEEKMILECETGQDLEKLKELLEERAKEEPTEKEKRIDEFNEKLKDNPKEHASGMIKGKIDQQKIQDPRLTPGMDSPQVSSALTNFQDTLRDKVGNGELSPSQAATIHANTLYGVHGQLSQGIAMNEHKLGSAFNASNPKGPAGTFEDGFWVKNKQLEAAGAVSQLNSTLLDPNKAPFETKNLNYTRFDLVRDQSLHFADASTVQQGPYGTCYTCAAESFGWQNAPADVIAFQHEAIWTGKFTSPYDGKVYNIPDSYLTPDRSALAWNPNSITSGEHSFSNQVNQFGMAHMAGYGNPGGGGNPSRLQTRGLQPITGFDHVPTESSFGGRVGFIEATNQGTTSVGQRYSIRGHADAVQSSYSYNPTTGQVDTYVIGDNSWSPVNERWVAANVANASQIGFPSGGGSSVGGGLGGGIPGLGGGIGGGGAPGGGSGSGNEQNETPRRPPNALEDEKNRDLLESACQQFVAAETSTLPQSCGQFDLSRAGRMSWSRTNTWVRIDRVKINSTTSAEMWHQPAILTHRRLIRRFPNPYYFHPHQPMPGISYGAGERGRLTGITEIDTAPTVDAASDSSTSDSFDF